MTQAFTSAWIRDWRPPLEAHPVYGAVHDIEALRLFMAHHVYSVWDFMSLIKYLQQRIAPTRVPWTPQGDGDVRRFINELVLEEESDERLGGGFASHLELYLMAMEEIGADAEPFRRFLRHVERFGIHSALSDCAIPEPARAFSRTTFEIIANDQPHAVAAALALGREHIIPFMFRRFLTDIGVNAAQAPVFHFYLNRHIHLDEDFHAPLSLRLLNALCGDDPQAHAEAQRAGQQALEARIRFWDGVETTLTARRTRVT